MDLPTGKVKGISKEESVLYVFDANKKDYIEMKKQTKAVLEKPDVELWHQRMGHVPLSILRKITIIRNNRTFHLNHCRFVLRLDK